MKFISWNVNGFRACLEKGFADIFAELDADFFCLQETKMQPGQADFAPEGYHQFWNSAEKKGYSGTAIFARHAPLSVQYGLGIPEHDGEGRAITLEYEDFYLLCVYTPNAQRELARLEYRMAWEDALRTYMLELDAKKPVIYCGDLNVAHNEIDLKNPAANRQNAGFSDQEREKFTCLLESGLPTPSVPFTPTGYNIPGGAICSAHGSGTRGGASTILWCPTVFSRGSRTVLFSPILWAATIAR